MCYLFEEIIWVKINMAWLSSVQIRPNLVLLLLSAWENVQKKFDSAVFIKHAPGKISILILEFERKVSANSERDTWRVQSIKKFVRFYALYLWITSKYQHCCDLSPTEFVSLIFDPCVRS